MVLPEIDRSFLENRAGTHVVDTEGGMICVVIRDYPLPSGFEDNSADLLLRISPGYPDVPPDMWWFDPPITRIDQRPIPATDVYERFLGRTWQRWSRHLEGGGWRSGSDSLESYIALVSRELQKAGQADS